MLYQHQIDAASWLAARPRAYLGDAPGIGKTRTIIAGLLLANVRNPLIVCPAIVRSHWDREFAAMGWEDLQRVYSYDAIVRGGDTLQRALLDGGVDALVLDEAHFCKNAEAVRTRLLLGKEGYSRRIPRVWAASGTPMPKHPGELWPLLSSLFPEVVSEFGLRTYRQFLDQFCHYKHTQYGVKVFGVKNVPELKQMLSCVMLRRTLDDVGLDLPRIWWSTMPIDAARGDELIRMESSEELLPLRDRLITRQPLDDINTSSIARYRRLLGEAKAPVVGDWLADELTGTDEKVVVFAYHRSVLGQLRDKLSAFGVTYVDGDTPHAQRTAGIELFQGDPAQRVFLGQITACQTGITLTAARRVVLVEPDWTAVVNQQAAHRVARIGQTAETCVAQLVALAGSLDEAIVRQHERELRIATEVLA